MSTRKNHHKRAQILSATLAKENQEVFTKIYAAHKKDWPGIKQALLNEGIAQEELQRLEKVYHLADITGDNTALIASLQNEVSTVRDMALHYDRKKIQSLLKEATLPEQTPGGTLPEKKAHYARQIEKQLFKKEPTAVITRMLKNKELVIKDKSILEGVVSFFEQDPDFNIRKTSVYSQAAKNDSTGLRKVDPLERAEVMNALKSIQRTSAISDDPVILAKLMELNLTSAHKIASQPENTFVNTYAAALGGQAVAEAVYNEAVNINTRNEYVLTALRDKVTGASIAAIDGQKGKEEAIALVQQIADQNNLQLNWEALFGNADLCECDECRSVYSAAAYLVELLQYMRSDGDGVDVLTEFLKRRPDIGNLQLTCENAHVPLPYIDLVNEVMESFIVHLPVYQAEGNIQLEVFNVNNETSEELLAIPQHINYNAYRMLSTATYPATLPYNQPLDAIRLLLQKLGTSRQSVMDTMGIPKSAFEKEALEKAQTAEVLGMSREEYITLTGQDFFSIDYYKQQNNRPNLTEAEYKDLIGVKPVWQHYGFTAEPAMLSELKQIKKIFLPRTGISFEELVTLLEAKWVNPALPPAPAMAILRRIPYSYRFLQSLVVDAPDPANKYAQVITLLQNAFQSQADKDAVKNWVLQYFSTVGNIIVLEWGGITSGGYYGYYYGGNTPADLKQIAQSQDIAKVTLQHLNGTPLNTDEYKKILGFIRLWRLLKWSMADVDSALSQTGSVNAVSYEAIRHISWAKRLHALTGLPIDRLLGLWFVMSTHGEQSLYKKVFMSPRILAIDPVFAPDANGNYFAGSPTITAHLAGVMAALQITLHDIVTIQSYTGVPDQLSIPNLSILYKFSYLARYLKLPIPRMLQLLPYFGDLTVNAATTYQFITTWQDIQAAKFKPEQLSYLLQNAPEPGVVPATKTVLSIARTLHEGLHSNEEKYAVQSVITEEGLRKQLLLLYAEETVNKIVALLNGTIEFTRTTKANLNIRVPASLKHRFSYNTATGQMTSKGILDYVEGGQLITLSGDATYQADVQELLGAPVSFINDTLFAFLPPGSTEREIILKPDTMAGFPSGKIAFFYNNYLPFLKRQQAQQLIIGELSAGLQLDAATTEWLLTTALTTANGSKPLISDIQKLAEPIATGNTWEGYLIPSFDDDYTFVISAAQTPSLWLNDQIIPLTGGVFETAPQKLKAGQLYKLKVTGLEGNLARLSWKTPTVPKMQVPAANLFAAIVNESFATVYGKLHKAALLIKGFSLGAEELRNLQVCQDGFAGLNLNTISWALWRRLRDYTKCRNQLKQTSLSLSAFLVWARNPGNGSLSDKIAALTGWNIGQVQQLLSAEQFNLTPASFINEQPLLKLQQAISLTAITGIDTGVMALWAAPVYDFNNCIRIAENIRSSMQARYTMEEWQQLVKPVNDQLRTNQRNALISYLLGQPALQQWAANRDMALDANALFDFFLLDVQMESSVETSRIRQALSSVQTYVQRCFLGLEKEVPTTALDRDRWQWMQQYRTWEANRKVFLYPENWIEPELRDSKSPFFKELEAELLQQDITPELIETAVRNYLYKLDGISNPDICAIYQEWDWRQVGLSDFFRYPTVSHIFARTRNIPYTYYYRNLNQDLRVWTPWQKIETDIQLTEDDRELLPSDAPKNGNCLVPVKWKGRLLLFWPVFTKKTTENSISNKKVSDHTMVELSNRPSKELKQLEYREIRLAWSEYKDGKWTARQTSGCVINTAIGATAPSLDRFIISQEGLSELLRIEVHLADAGDTLINVGGFVFSDGDKISTAPATEYTKQQHYPKNAASKFMHFYPLAAGELDITLAEYPYEPERGLVFSKQLSDYKLVRTFQREFQGYTEDHELTFAYQELKTNNTHNRTFLGIFSYGGREIENFYHPYTGVFLQALNNGGLSDLLSTLTQQSNQYAPAKAEYNPVFVYGWPGGGVDFGTNYSYMPAHEPAGTYSIYNWELFFHIPLLIADRLSKSRQYEQARNWFHYIFNPLAEGQVNDVRRYWQFLPFKTSEIDSITAIMYNLQAGQVNYDIEAWRNDPYNPHLIARSRPAAYMKNVVMKYLDNLIAWGDHLYRQNTMETINQSIMLYVMAGHILGPRPQVIPQRGTSSAQTYNSLKDQWDAFGNAMVEMELAFPYSGQVMYEGGLEHGKPYQGNNVFGFGASLYFGIPNNPKLIQYWDTVADRLFKIRHSMNIDGMVQKPALFEPPIDPALLVQAAANGISLNSVLNDLNVSMPYHRFNYLTTKALEICSEVRSLGQQLLSVIERKDAESLARLRTTHELNLLNAIKAVKLSQLEEARAQLETLHKTRENVGKRLLHYQQLLGLTAELPAVDGMYKDLDGMYGNMQEEGGLNLIDLEREDMNKSSLASGAQIVAGVMEAGASIANAFPTASAHAQPIGVGASVAYGGANIGSAIAAGARVIQTVSARLQYEAGAAAKKTGFLRQRQDWILQANTAGNELLLIDKQLIAANIRIAIAEKEWKNQELQIAQAGEVQDYMTSKYTNVQLYQWMEGQARTIYHQAYQLAYDMARKAEKAYRYEKGESNTNFIQLAYWDSSRDGLLAGEQLALAIRQMERAYTENHKRQYEITKNISLAQWDPLALINLKETGNCELQLSEALFDFDFPGHYMRRIKSMSVSIPCIAGPHTSVSATLTLLQDKTRVSSITGSQYAEEMGAADNRFVNNFSPQQSIATSHAQNDAGLFELNFRDERFLPFEGAGAVSRWRLELPGAFRHFDYDTIPDVVFHISYTAKEGGDMLRQAAIDHLDSSLQSAEGEEGLVRLFSLRHEFSAEWHQFLHPVNGQHVLTLTGLKDRLPFFTRSQRVQQIEVTAVELLVRGTATAWQLNNGPLSAAASIGSINRFTASTLPGLADTWQVTAADTDLHDAWLVVKYSLQTS